jgi:hypothetical protein
LAVFLLISAILKDGELHGFRFLKTKHQLKVEAQCLIKNDDLNSESEFRM